MATIRTKGPYQWHAQTKRKGWPQQTRTFNTQAEAKALATMVQRDMDTGEFVTRNEAKSTFFDKALEIYAEQARKKRSRDSELSRIQALKCRPLAL